MVNSATKVLMAISPTINATIFPIASNLIFSELKKLGREDIGVIAGGVIPEQDFDFLFNAGCVGIFGPGTKIASAAQEILTLMIEALQGE